eukprot:3014178-Prymnesium_polylepis.2
MQRHGQWAHEQRGYPLGQRGKQHIHARTHLVVGATQPQCHTRTACALENCLTCANVDAGVFKAMYHTERKLRTME